MADYITIQNEVLSLVIDTPAAVQTLVPRFVNRAIRKLEQKHNFKVMESEVPYTTTLLTRTLGSRPSDWKEARKDPYHTEESGLLVPMKWVSDKQSALAKYGDNSDFDYGQPKLLYEDDDNGTFLVFPFPDGLSDYSDGEYRVTVPYWKMLADLSADADTNWFTTNAEEYIINRATAYAFFANEDEERGKHWLALAGLEYSDVLLADKRRRFGETQTLVFHVGAMPPHTQE